MDATRVVQTVKYALGLSALGAVAVGASARPPAGPQSCEVVLIETSRPEPEAPVPGWAAVSSSWECREVRQELECRRRVESYVGNLNLGVRPLRREQP